MLGRPSPQTQIGVIQAVNADGTLTVTIGSSSLTLGVTREVLVASPAAGMACLLAQINESYCVVGTLGTGAASTPNLIPNGSFALPGGGGPPTGWVLDSGATLTSQDTAGPAADACAVATLNATLTATTGFSLKSPVFRVDPGSTYVLAFSLWCDSTIVTPQAWPSLNCYPSTGDTSWATNVTNGVLSPTPGTAWQKYATTLTIPTDQAAASVNLGFFGGSGSTGTWSFAESSLTKTV